jgi:hypothetical protein
MFRLQRAARSVDFMKTAITVRIDDAQLVRLYRLVHRPDGGEDARGEVIRRALERGLVVLEAERATATPTEGTAAKATRKRTARAA